MADNTNPTNPRRLGDEELAKVAGGIDSSWDSSLEEIWLGRFEQVRESYAGSFEDYMMGQPEGEDLLKARRLWIDGGRRTDTVYIHYSDGRTDSWRIH